MELRIESQIALIGIERTEGQYEIKQHQWPMTLNATDAQLEIHMEEAVLRIDQHQCFAEAGLKSAIELGKMLAAKGRTVALKAISRIAREGKEMADFHKGVVLPAQAKGRFNFRKQEFTFDMIPKSRPEITVTPGEVTGQFQQGGVDIRTGKITPEVNYHRGQIDVYLRQKNSIQIDFVGKNIDVLGG